jgi:hypothetical protein
MKCLMNLKANKNILKIQHKGLRIRTAMIEDDPKEELVKYLNKKSMT